MSEITYILGAGASYYSMPIVEYFANRFDLFVKFLNSLRLFHQYESLRRDVYEFSKEIRHHVSFDTFFKKLFHTNSNLEVAYKPILLLFFIFEHHVNVDDYRETYSGNDVNSYGEKKFNRDSRYDALIAALLKPIKNERIFYTKINFITWNYDLNLLDSLKSYLFPETEMNKFLSKNNSGNFFNLDNKVNIIHFNGYMNHGTFDSIDSLGEAQLIAYFEKLFRLYEDNPQDFVEYSNYLKFSWETIADYNEDISSVPFIKKAKEAIQQSSVIVIIGYSFPLYNRMIDSELINLESIRSKMIYIQDPHASSIESILRNDLGLGKIRNEEDRYDGIGIDSISSNAVSLITDCRSFFVPSSLFLKPEKPKEPRSPSVW